MATFQDLLTFTRGSDGTAYDRFGDLATYGIDTPRFQHDPATLTTSSTTIDLDSLAVGDSVLIDLPGSDTFAAGKDISVTDSADINRYITGVVEFSSAGSVQVTVKTINGTGSGSSWTLIENLGLLIEEQRTRLNTIAAAPTSPENVTVTATAHTISFFGTGTVDLTGVATETLVGTGADERVTLTFTPTAGTLTITPSGTVTDLQLEEGGFATSVIRGEGSQVTRAADNCSRTLGAEFNAEEFTAVTKQTIIVSDDSVGNPFLVIGSNANNRISLFYQGVVAPGRVRLVAREGGSSVGDGFFNTSLRSGDTANVAIAVTPSRAHVYLNGTEIGDVTLSYSDIGAVLGTLYLSDTLDPSTAPSLIDFSYIMPRALSATELEALTAP